MPPVPFERFRPLMKRPDRLRIRAIEHPPTVATHINEADLPQDAQVLRNRRLLHPQRIHNLPDRPLVQRKIVQNLPPPRLRHGIEGIRSRCRSCHGLYITFPYRNMSTSFFLYPRSSLGSLLTSPYSPIASRLNSLLSSI